jgi:hypothetical protein
VRRRIERWRPSDEDLDTLMSIAEQFTYRKRSSGRTALTA